MLKLLSGTGGGPGARVILSMLAAVVLPDD